MNIERPIIINVADTVAQILLEIKGVTLNPKKPYRYVSGILSPVYTDCRILMAYPDKRRQIRDFYIENIKNSGAEFEVIAGTATAGIPHAAWIADKLELPMIYIRGKAKDHGKENLIEGIIKEGQNAIVIEDLISTGESSINSANAIRAAGGKISSVFCIMTYDLPKAKTNFKDNNITLFPLTTFADVVKKAEELNYVGKEEVETILEWTADPAGWGKKMGFE